LVTAKLPSVLKLAPEATKMVTQTPMVAAIATSSHGNVAQLGLLLPGNNVVAKIVDVVMIIPQEMVALARLLLGLRVVVVTIAMDMVSRAGDTVLLQVRQAELLLGNSKHLLLQVVSKAMEATVLILGRAMATTTRRSPLSRVWVLLLALVVLLVV